MPYEVEIDADACNGYGNCELAAPDVFELSRTTNVATVRVPRPVGRDAEVLEAVDDCPTRAIKATRI